MPGKPASICNQGQWHTFQVYDDGVLHEAYGGPQDSSGVTVPGFAPNADLSIQRVWPDPANPFGTYYAVSGANASGHGIRSVYWVGANWQPADHWEGPVDCNF